MYTLKIQNGAGELYDLTHDREHYRVLSVNGLTLPHCGINTSSNGTQDGEVYNSSHLEKRNLVIQIALEGDIEASRQKLYRIFPPHTPIQVFFKNHYRDVVVEAYVEMIDGSLFEMRESMQISLICPEANWQDIYESQAEISGTPLLFQFPFSIAAPGVPVTEYYDNPAVALENKGDMPVGFTARLCISADERPELTTTTQTIDLEEMLKYQFDIFNDVEYSVTDDTLYVYLSGSKTTEFSEGIVLPSGDPYIKFDSAPALGASLHCDIYSAGAGRSITDLRLKQEDKTTYSENRNGYYVLVSVPAWFDTETSEYHLYALYQYEGNVDFEVPRLDIEKFEDGSAYAKIYLVENSNHSYYNRYFEFTAPTPEEYYPDWERQDSIYSKLDPSTYEYSDTNYTLDISVPESFTLSDDYTLKYKKNESDAEWLDLDTSWINSGFPTLENRFLHFELTVPSGTFLVGMQHSKSLFSTKNKDDYKYYTNLSIDYTYENYYHKCTLHAPWALSSKDNFAVYTLAEQGGEIVDDITESAEIHFTSGIAYFTFLWDEFSASTYLRLVAWHSDDYNDGDISGIPHGDFTIQAVDAVVGYPRKAIAETMQYSSIDRRTVYLGERKITAAVSDVTLAEPCWLVQTNEDITSDITIEIVSSIDGDDVHDYTDAEIDAAMKYVVGLKLENRTTGEYMQFPDVKFRDGDVVGVSTVPGNLYVTVLESDWMTVGKSLIYEVMRNGSFFRLGKGENVIDISADFHTDYISCELKYKNLYGGV